MTVNANKQNDRAAQQMRSISGLAPVGRLLWNARAIRCYCDGDGVGFVWRWWHPLSWVLAPAVVVVGVLLDGIPETLRSKHEIGFGMKPWFITRPDRLIWISHSDITEIKGDVK